MFPKTQNIETSFRLIRMSCMVTIVGCLVFSGLVVFRCLQTISQMQSKIYILSSGKVLEAFASDRKDNVKVEAVSHIKTFHTDFFTLDADEKVINENLTKALYMADASAKRVYENLKESGYYAGVVSSNITQRISIDSIQLDMTYSPFYFRLYGLEKITRPTSIVTRSLVTEGWLRNVSRSDNNPHGFLIERWAIVENKGLTAEPR